MQLDLGDGHVRRLYAIYQPRELVSVVYGRWNTIKSWDSRLRAKGFDPADRDGEIAARRWLESFRHSVGSRLALILADLP